MVQVLSRRVLPSLFALLLQFCHAGASSRAFVVLASVGKLSMLTSISQAAGDEELDENSLGSEDLANVDAQALLEDLDDDGDGVLDVKEFMQLAASASEKDKKGMKKKFKKSDADGDGKISKEELPELLNTAAGQPRALHPHTLSAAAAAAAPQGFTPSSSSTRTTRTPGALGGGAAVGAVVAVGVAAAHNRRAPGKRSGRTSCRQRPLDAPAMGNLVKQGDAWRINPAFEPGSLGARSNCSVLPSRSEYADAEDSGATAWVSKSLISFDYRVVEVPRGRLLDPDCDALIFGHLSPSSLERVMAETRPQRRLVVIDEFVHDLYGQRVRAYFEARGVEHDVLVLPMVEENKSMELVLEVAQRMKDFNIDRRTEPVLAIGGGVCLDVVGLAASLFRRRTPYIRVPTTALSYVDASVGAKNGVNFGGSKNRLGSYVPPCAALLDAEFFATQDRREVANGMAEMAKMAIMKSPELFQLLEEHGTRLADRKFMPAFEGDKAPARVLQLSIQTMLEELAPNLWEHSLDRLVDFGHAVGQDLEMAALGTEHELMHGESVACDMALMTVLAQCLGLLTEAQRDRTLVMLKRCQVPLWSPVMTYELFMEAVSNRVKNSMGQRFPLPQGIGAGRIVNDVEDEDLRRAFLLWRKLCGPGGVHAASPPRNVAASA